MTAQVTALPLPPSVVITGEHLLMLPELFRDAIEHRAPNVCEDCIAEGLCTPCSQDLDRTDAYLRLAAELGIDLETDEAGLS